MGVVRQMGPLIVLLDDLLACGDFFGDELELVRSELNIEMGRHLKYGQAAWSPGPGKDISLGVFAR